MRVDPHVEGSVLHVVKRGARGIPIVHDKHDRRHFLQCLLYLNDEHRDENWQTTIKPIPFLTRPNHYPPQRPIVNVWAWTLMTNHFHLILQERRKGGIATFMQRLGGSMSMRANRKYEEKGSLFQGSYRGRVVEDTGDLRWLASYVMVKNIFELYPGGLLKAEKTFEHAWQWGVEYEFSSMKLYATKCASPILAIKENTLLKMFKESQKFKKDSRDMIISFVEKRELENRSALALE